MDRIMEWLVKLLFIVMLAPFVVGVLLKLLVGIAVTVLPWVILGAVVAGVAAGLTAAMILRRRLPLPGGSSLPPGPPPLGAHRVRRPRSNEWR